MGLLDDALAGYSSTYRGEGGILGRFPLGLWDELRPDVRGFAPAPQPQLPPSAVSATLPAASAPVSGPIAAPEQPNPLGEIGGRLGAGFLGMLNSGSPASALGALIQGLATGRRSDPQGMMQEQQAATYNYLVRSGTPPDQALIIAQNPKAQELFISQMVQPKTAFQKLTDAFGNERLVLTNATSGTVSAPREEGSGAGTGINGGDFLARGVGQVNSDLSGQAYLDQFSPEMKAAVRAYIEGRAMPTGNPRKGFTQAVKMVAQKVAADEGTTADDTTFAARNAMRRNLSVASPSSLGGQINIGNTAIGHLDDLSQKALALGNWDAGIPLLSRGINYVRGAASTEQSAKLDALKMAAQHYGQEITKFYAGSPGGEGERNRFLEAVNGSKTPRELAAVIQTEAELAHSRVQAIESQIRGTLGDAGIAQYPAVRPETERALGSIRAAVGKLRGEPEGNITSSGVRWSIR